MMRSSLNITYLLARQNDMNRKKKLIQLLKKKSRGNPEKRL
jgi:hypothetical protein